MRWCTKNRVRVGVRDMPKAVRREIGAYFPLCVASLWGATITLGVFVVAENTRVTRHPWGQLLLVAFVLFSALFVLCLCVIMRKGAAYADLAREHHYLLCPDCGYRLAGGPETGACQECGSHYEKSRAVRVWQAFCRGEKPELGDKVREGGSGPGV